MNCTARIHDRNLSWPRTIADPAGQANIATGGLLEAIGYGSLDRKLHG